MFTHVVIHYAEIATKKGNREFFEKALARNIKRKLPQEKLKRDYGRFLIELSGGYDREKIIDALSKTFGIANFSFAAAADLDMNDITMKSLLLAKESDFRTFRVSTRRLNKSFPLTSMQVNEAVGTAVCVEGKSVSLTKPELEINIEIVGKKAYIYSDVIQGPGGLPVGVSGKVVSLISGGIDSPVAAWLAMKRGCKCIFIHFHNYTLYSDSVKNKITRLVKVLSDYNGPTKLYIVPFAGIQQEIIKNVPSEVRMIAYRRAMLRIADQIRQETGGKAFVTGDSIAQVASQTLDNLDVIYSVVSKPIIAPLIGYDKKETIKLAERLRTYEISILPYSDCCSAFIAEHPSLRSTSEELAACEKNLNFGLLAKNAIEKAEVLEFT
jgi:thiamine biosynthesis protein ThiI